MLVLRIDLLGDLNKLLLAFGKSEELRQSSTWKKARSLVTLTCITSRRQRKGDSTHHEPSRDRSVVSPDHRFIDDRDANVPAVVAVWDQRAATRCEVSAPTGSTDGKPQCAASN